MLQLLVPVTRSLHGQWGTAGTQGRCWLSAMPLRGHGSAPSPAQRCCCSAPWINYCLAALCLLKPGKGNPGICQGAKEGKPRKQSFPSQLVEQSGRRAGLQAGQGPCVTFLPPPNRAQQNHSPQTAGTRKKVFIQGTKSTVATSDAAQLESGGVGRGIYSAGTAVAHALW